MRRVSQYLLYNSPASESALPLAQKSATASGDVMRGVRIIEQRPYKKLIMPQMKADIDEAVRLLGAPNLNIFIGVGSLKIVTIILDGGCIYMCGSTTCTRGRL